MNLWKKLFNSGGDPAGKTSHELRDTQLVPGNIDPANFPELSLDREAVTFEGQSYPLWKWLQMHRGTEVYLWTMPEKDYGEPRFPLEWALFRTSGERKRIEKAFIDHYIATARLLVSYGNAGKVDFSQEQFLTANLAVVWLLLAPKYRMIRREFESLRLALDARLQAALVSAFR